MTGPLKRRRGNVSYKEPSTDIDEDEDESGGSDPEYAHARNPATRRPLRSDQAASPTGSPDAPPIGTAFQNGLQLRARPKVSYQEPDSAAEDESEFESHYEASSPPKRVRVTTPSRAKKEKSTRRRQPRAPGTPLKPMKDHASTTATQKVVSDGVIPAWSTLPYHVLLQVFVYASHPLYDENFTSTRSISWLARTALVCSAFTKPALTALYRNPPIFAVRQHRKELVHHLITPPPQPFMDYSVMVKRLEIDASRISRLTDHQSSASDLIALLTSSKTLKEIDIFEPFDKPPHRERFKNIRRWYYPDNLFTALDQSEVRLRGWRWNGNYLAKGPLWIKEVHARPPFQSLRELTITKLHSKESSKLEKGEPTTEELLGSALAVLPNLKSLIFETCTTLNERLLPLLPANLVNLNVTNCRDLTSDALEAFLVTHGSRLQELTLNHNQSLNMSFLVHLKQHCPRLEVLRMDLTYYSSLSLSLDNEPLYDVLLEEGEVPSWPSTLAVIELEFLRNWSAISAVNFFGSLIDSAHELPWLRELVITAMVDLDWRQRAEFRKTWTKRFQKVFARKAVQPDPTLMSLRAFRESKLEGKIPDVGTTFSPVDGILGIAPDESESDAPLITRHKWSKQRLRSRANASPRYDETSDSEAWIAPPDEPDFIQGGCYKVVFRIDNSRPVETIFGENDFLDDEISGDEDWDGSDPVVDETVYQW